MARKMKDSGIPWVGKIPEDWEVTRLKYLYSICPSLNITRDNLTETGCPVLSYGQIHSKKNSGYQINLDLVKYVPTIYTSPKALASKGDFLFADTSEDLEGCGNCIYVDSDFSVYAGAHVLFAKRRISSKENGRYLAFLFLSDAWRKQLRESVAGVKVYSVKKSMLSNAHILLPPLSEQARIAEYLDKTVGRIDGLREKISREIERLGDYKKSMISEAVCRGLDKTAKMKDSGIPWVGKIPEDWEVTRNKYVMRKSKQICDVWAGQPVMSLSMKGVIARDLDNPSGKMPATFDGYQFVNRGDLLMCLFDLDVTPRCVGRVESDGVTSPAYSRYRLFHRANRSYVYYYYLMMDNSKELVHLAKSCRHAMPDEEFRKLSMILPPLPEQRRIAEYIDKQVARIDALVEKRKEELERLEALKRSIICECVTGKREVA